MIWYFKIESRYTGSTCSIFLGAPLLFYYIVFLLQVNILLFTTWKPTISLKAMETNIGKS